jgi:hypothetical protein
VKLSLSVRLLPAEGGTTVAFTGTATGDGRIAELPEDAVASAGGRLLGRFAEKLGASAEAASEDAVAKQGEPASEDLSGTEAEGTPEGAAATGEGEAGGTPSVFDAEVPPPSLDPIADEEEREDDFAVDGFGDEGELPAEAAHARRTMIGRSAEEVDHAPPRGRYAPVPAPETTTATETLRWAAPAAALILASAIVAGRLLRRRR